MQGRETPETVAADPTIYEQAHWDADAERLAELYEQFRSQPRDHFTATLWREHWIDHQTMKQLALKIGELMAMQAQQEAPKPVQKRAVKAPKAALPEPPEFDGPDAA